MLEDRAGGVGVEVALLAIAVGVVACAAALWAGAVLAALLFGAQRLPPISFADALGALRHVGAHVSDPQLLWPRPVRPMLPGAVPLWACTLAVLLALLAALVAACMVVMRRRRVGPQRRRRMGVDPEARFARSWELAPLWVRHAVAGRVVLGEVSGHLVATEDRTVGVDACVPWWLRRRASRRAGDRGAIVVVGPSRCGKTTALAIPAILEWAGPVVALSVKADWLDATIEARRRVGAVQVFDPTDATGVGDACWSPLRAAVTLSGARRAAQALSNATDWAAAGGDMRFWVTNA